MSRHSKEYVDHQGDGARLRLLYLLDLLPTYVAREVHALSGNVRGSWDIEIHLPVSSPVTGMWRRILPEGADTTGRADVHTDMHMEWCTGSAAKVLLSALPSCLTAFIRHPVRFMRGIIDAIRRGSLRHFLIAVNLAERCIRTTPDIIHSHFAKDAANIAMWLSGLLNIPYTVTTHANDIFVPDSEIRVAEVLGRAAGSHTISSHNREYISRRYGAELGDRTFVSRLGLNAALLPKTVPTEGVPVFTCTASGLVPKKGVDVLLEACSLLRESGEEIRCRIIGSDPAGDVLESLRKRVIKAGLDGMVSFMGLLTAEQVLEAVSRSTAFVLPSVEAPNGDMDGIPVALMEAMGMGVPAISTRLSGIPELVENGITGLVVEPGDAKALANAMRKLSADPTLARQLGAEGRRKVLSDFTLKRYASDMTRFWTELLSLCSSG